MRDVIVFYAPETCSRVPMMSLEEAGVEYACRLVAHRAGEHKAPDYLRFNPAGKVPALVVEGRPLSENVAIVSYLAQRYPDANLLPRPDEPLEAARVTSDLAFCASVLHPLVSRLRIPAKFCNLDGTDRNVWDLAAAEMRLHFERIERRLSTQGPWWYGDAWSSIDAYINWVWFRSTDARFPVEPYPAFAGHDRRMAERPSMRRVLAREADGQRELRERGLVLEFKPVSGLAATS